LIKKDELIKDLKLFQKITNYKERAKAVKAYLLTHIVDERAFISNEEAYEKSLFINEYYRKMSWNDIEDTTICFQNVLGGDHFDYIKQSPMQMIINEAKRMTRIFNYLADNPEYFFNQSIEQHNDPISYFSFVDKDGQKKFIATEGNHRTAMGLFLQSICYDSAIQINNVNIIEVEFNYELLNLIQETQKNIYIYNYELFIEKRFIYFKGCNYNLISRLSLYSRKNGYTNNLFLTYNEKDIENSIIENDKEIFAYLNNALNKIPKHQKILIEGQFFIKSLKTLLKYIFTK
jgi:hypothetical protein